jgi:hypothetical protein
MAVINNQGGTAAALTATNPVIADRVLVYETDTGLCKIGDGVTAWTSLRYVTIRANDVTTGTLADARLSASVQNAINLYLWSSCR